MSGVVASIKDGVEEVAQGAGRVARRIVVGGLLGLAAVSALPSDGNAQTVQPRTIAIPGATTQGLTDEQCRIFKGYLTDHIRVIGRQHLTDDFVNAMVEFAINRRCAAPASIPVSTSLNIRDLDVFNSISGIMRQTQGIDLRRIGIVPVARTASLQ